MEEDVRPFTVIRTTPSGTQHKLYFWWRQTDHPECWAGMLIGHPQIVFGTTRSEVRTRGDALFDMLLARHKFIADTIDAEMAAGKLKSVEELNRRLHALRTIASEVVLAPIDQEEQ